jgi:hypothetical protein
VYARIKSRLSFHDLFFEIPLLDINWTIKKIAFRFAAVCRDESDKPGLLKKNYNPAF